MVNILTDGNIRPGQALIAVARKVIILDVKEYPSLTVFAIAALILALSVAFFLERWGRRRVQDPEP